LITDTLPVSKPITTTIDIQISYFSVVRSMNSIFDNYQNIRLCGYAKSLNRPFTFWIDWRISFFKAWSSEGVNIRVLEDFSGFSLGEGFNLSFRLFFTFQFFGIFYVAYSLKMT